MVTKCNIMTEEVVLSKEQMIELKKEIIGEIKRYIDLELREIKKYKEEKKFFYDMTYL